VLDDECSKLEIFSGIWDLGYITCEEELDDVFRVELNPSVE
jgi:hypothetical protein